MKLEIASEQKGSQYLFVMRFVWDITFRPHLYRRSLLVPVVSYKGRRPQAATGSEGIDACMVGDKRTVPKKTLMH